MRKRVAGKLAVLLLLAMLGGSACQPPPSNPVPEIPGGTLMQWLDLSWFAYVPAAEGFVGHDETVESDHAPQYSLEVDGFWIQQSEVSNSQYRSCVDAGACTPPAVIENLPYWYGLSGYADHPVTGVTWGQADAYCKWIYARLPFEAEWEIAARGIRGQTYPWGESAPDCALANSAGCQAPDEPDAQGEHPTGASPYNALDMTGNVREWAYDWYAPDWYPGGVGGPAEGTARVVRGGGYLTAASDLAVWLRDSLAPDQYAPDLGFRCALNDMLPEQAASQPPGCLGCSCQPPPPEIPPDIPTVPPPVCPPPPLAGDPPPQVPAVPPGLDVNGYCHAGVAGVVVVFGPGDDPNNYFVYGPQGPLNCDIGADRQACWGTGVSEDTTVEITVCPACPQGYTYDWDTHTCLGAAAALEPVQVLPPDYDPSNPLCSPDIKCPPMTFVAEDDNGCLYCQSLVIVEEFCEPGSHYDDAAGCCMPDQIVCPPGYEFDAQLYACVPIPPLQECQTFTVYIPACVQLQAVCNNPAQYGNQADCEGANCRWELGPLGMRPYCTYP